MKWILFQQHPNSIVKFFTNEIDDPTFLTYKKFRELILKTVSIQRKQKFLESLDRFEIIFLDCVTGNWSIEEEEYKTDHSLSSLIKLNEREKKDSPFQGIIDQGKSLIKNLSRKYSDKKLKILK